LQGDTPASLQRVTDEAAKKFIERCIQPLATRPTVAELLTDEFMSNVPSLQLPDNTASSGPTPVNTDVSRHLMSGVPPLQDDHHKVQKQPIDAATSLPQRNEIYPSTRHTLMRTQHVTNTGIGMGQGVGHGPAVTSGRVPTTLGSEIDGTIKVYFREHEDTPEVIRVDLASCQTVEDLVQLLREEFEFDDDFVFRVKYLVFILRCLYIINQ